MQSWGRQPVQSPGLADRQELGDMEGVLRDLPFGFCFLRLFPVVYLVYSRSYS